MKKLVTLAIAGTAMTFAGLVQAQTQTQAEGGESGADTAQATPLSPSRVTVAPLRLEMDGETTSTILRVANPSQRKIGVQLRIFAWSQENGEDIYTPTGDMRVSPSIITIEPGATQIFRVMRRPGASAGEQRFRAVIDQLPDPELVANGVSQARIRFTLPIFVNRSTARPAQLAWSINGNHLTVANSGEQTARMVNLSLTDSAGNPVKLAGNGLHYLMGGQTTGWDLPGGCPATSTTVSVLVDGEAANVPVAPSC